jgi:polyisoprenoid-binding protein YceI
MLLALVAVAASVPFFPVFADPAKPWTYDLDHSEGSVTFVAIGRPSLLKVKGKGAAPKGTLKLEGGKLSGECTFDMNTLDTGISMRTEHMKKKYLEVEKYPQAKLTQLELAVPAGIEGDSFGADKVPFKAHLTFHGVDKPVEGTAKLTRSAGKLEVDSQFPVNFIEHGIEKPSFAGITINDVVDVDVDVTAPFAPAQASAK